MAENPDNKTWVQLVSDLRELRESLARGIETLEERAGASEVLDSPRETANALESFVHLTKAKVLAERIVAVLDGFLEELGHRAFPRSEEDGTTTERVYSVKQLTAMISEMINTPQSRRKRTYIPPFDIEKTLRALARLEREKNEHIEIRVEDPEIPGP